MMIRMETMGTREAKTCGTTEGSTAGETEENPRADVRAERLEKKSP
jgi:hypothetical protein